MKIALDAVVPESTYRACYRGESSKLPLIMYKDLPGLYSPGATEPSRKHCQSENRQKYMLKPRPAALAAPPHVLAPSKRPKSGKRSVFEGSDHVFDTKFGPMSVDMVNEMYRKRRYETCSQKANDEYGLPMHRPQPSKTTRELRPDLVRMRSQKYDERPEEWQDAVLWDRIQNRPWSPRTTTPTAGERLLQRRKKQTTSGFLKDNEILRLVKTDGLANVFVKKCPGYAGYAPLCPPDTRLDDKKCPVDMTSTMKASYRKFSESGFLSQMHHRKGPFSKTVTLTLPFNPFNKFGQDDEIQKDGKYVGMQSYLESMHDSLLRRN